MFTSSAFVIPVKQLPTHTYYATWPITCITFREQTLASEEAAFAMKSSVLSNRVDQLLVNLTAAEELLAELRRILDTRFSMVANISLDSVQMDYEYLTFLIEELDVGYEELWENVCC